MAARAQVRSKLVGLAESGQVWSYLVGMADLVGLVGIVTCHVAVSRMSSVTVEMTYYLEGSVLMLVYGSSCRIPRYY